MYSAGQPARRADTRSADSREQIGITMLKERALASVSGSFCQFHESVRSENRHMNVFMTTDSFALDNE